MENRREKQENQEKMRFTSSLKFILANEIFTFLHEQPQLQMNKLKNDGSEMMMRKRKTSFISLLYEILQNKRKHLSLAFNWYNLRIPGSESVQQLPCHMEYKVLKHKLPFLLIKIVTWIFQNRFKMLAFDFLVQWDSFFQRTHKKLKSVLLSNSLHSFILNNIWIITVQWNNY